MPGVPSARPWAQTQVGGADGAPLYLPSLPSAMRQPAKSLGPSWGPALRWPVCVRHLWAHCCSSLLLRWVFWSYALGAVTKVRLGQSLCEVGMFSLYYKVRLAVKGPLDRVSTSEPTPAPLTPEILTCSWAHRLKAHPRTGKAPSSPQAPGLHPWSTVTWGLVPWCVAPWARLASHGWVHSPDPPGGLVSAEVMGGTFCPLLILPGQP